jgi:hypothetical protein
MWKLEANERTARWRDFRKTLALLPFDRALEAVAEFWHGCPFHPFYLDPENVENWPDPWQLITENYYCDLAKALGMLYTIHLSEHRNNINAEIRVYYDPENKYTYNLVVFDQGKYVLNFRDDTVVNTASINKNLKLKKTYTSIDLKLQDY